jgi:Flp pilus assembly protein TadG
MHRAMSVSNDPSQPSGGHGGAERRSRRLLRRGRGQAVFEFVLVLPVFVAFLLLALYFGLWMYAHVSVANAAREGARFAAVGCGGTCGDGDPIKQRVTIQSGGIVDSTGDVDVWWTDWAAPFSGVAPYPTKGDAFKVRVTHGHPFRLVPGSNPTMTVTACAEMRVEADDLTATIPSRDELC